MTTGGASLGDLVALFAGDALCSAYPHPLLAEAIAQRTKPVTVFALTRAIYPGASPADLDPRTASAIAVGFDLYVADRAARRTLRTVPTP